MVITVSKLLTNQKRPLGYRLGLRLDNLKMEIEQGFKTFLEKRGIAVEEFKNGSLQAKFRLLKTYENSKLQGELFIHSFFDVILR